MHYTKLNLIITYYLTKYFYANPIIKLVFIFCFTLLIKNTLDLSNYTSNYTFCMEDVSPDTKILRPTRTYKQLPILEEKASSISVDLNYEEALLEQKRNIRQLKETVRKLKVFNAELIQSNTNLINTNTDLSNKYLIARRTIRALKQDNNLLAWRRLSPIYEEVVIPQRRLSIPSQIFKQRKF